jgi:type II secretory pathway pseudopilin PulG
MMFDSLQKNLCVDNRAGEKGWALLGLLLALTIMSIVMVSAITPNVTAQVQREKEEEMIYRGEQISVAIARYYNNGGLNGIQLMAPPPYGYLTELKKLRDGVNIGVREVKFIRPSAMIDPMISQEWEPVRARDPRIMKVLQAWAAETQLPIPTQYMLLAGPPQKLHLANPSGDNQQQPGGDGKSSQGGTKPPGNPGADPGDPDPNDPDGDPDDIADNDPLSHLFGSGLSGGSGLSNAPIVGVAPKVKGTALRPLYGLERYEDWVFIFIPKILNRPGTFGTGGNNQNGGKNSTGGGSTNGGGSPLK